MKKKKVNCIKKKEGNKNKDIRKLREKKKGKMRQGKKKGKKGEEVILVKLIFESHN